jgi:hypothetical protein
LFGTKSKSSSKKGKVGIQMSSSEKLTEIKFERDDCGDDISDGDAWFLYCTGGFSHDKHVEKWVQCVRCYRWKHEDCGVMKTALCAPCAEKVKIVSFFLKYLLFYIRKIFLF